MKKVILILIVSVAFLSAKTQVKDTVSTGKIIVASMGDTISVVDAITRNTVVTSKSGVSAVDEVFYVPTTAPNDTIYTLMAARTSGKKAAILLERDSERDTTITVSGDSLVFGAYGTGARPKLYGSKLITGWTLHSGNIWKAEVGDTIEKLFVNDVEMQLARLTDDGFSEITAVTSNSVFTPNAPVEADGYYEGCIAILRSEPWKSDVRTVTDYTSGVFTVSSAASSTLTTADGLLILNKLEFLDSAGEWFYDTATDTVYLWKSDSTEPTDTEVRGSTTDYGIDIGTNSYVHVRDLNLKHFRNRGINSDGVGNPAGRIINNNVIEGSNNGIYLFTTTNVNDEIRNNQILNSTSYGIFTYNSGNMTIADNRIEDTGELHTWGYYASGDGGSGIATSQGTATQRNSIKNNSIINSGYNGIFWRGAVDIFQNYVYQSNMVKSDGGSIYTGSPTSRTSTVTYNIVDYSLGPINGSSASRTFGEGIYIDEGAIGVTVEYNTSINNSANGIFLHKPDSSVVRYNKVFNNLIGFGSHNTAGSPTTVSDNTFITGNTAPYFYPRQLLARYITDSITFSNNLYINGLSSDLVFSNASGVYLNFADWQDSISGDSGSTYDGTDLLNGEEQRLIYNPTKVPQTWYENEAETDSIDGSIVLQPFTSKYIRGKYLSYIRTDSTAAVISTFEVDNYIAATSSGISDSAETKLRNLVYNLKLRLGTDSLSSCFDLIRIYAAETAEAALINLVDTSNVATLTASPTFTAFEGLTFDGASNYANENWIPENGITFLQNSASYGIYFRTITRGTNKLNGGYSTTAGGGTTEGILIGTSGASDTRFYLNNGIGSATISDTSTDGFWIASRNNSSDFDAFINDTKTTITATSSQPIDQRLHTGGRITTDTSVGLYCPSQISFVFAGRGFSESEIANIIDAFEDYMDSNGKGVID